MSKWLFAALLMIHAHFAASYLVPLDEESQGAFGGLLRWVWPWSDGDSGPLGEVTVASGFPVTGFFLAMATAGMFVLAALAVVGIWVPSTWWRVLTVGGAFLMIALMLLFFGVTKLLPMALALVVLWITFNNWPMASWSAVPQH
jgi:hypothetical protein